MSDYYTTYGVLQKSMKDYYQRTGQGLEFSEAIEYLSRKHLLSEEKPKPIDFSHVSPAMPDEEFEKIIDNMTIEVPPSSDSEIEIDETAVIPRQQDVFIIRHPRYTRFVKHAHDYFELNFVANGSCTFFYEDTSRTLKKGELCIIAPGLKHDIQILDDSTVFCILIRKSTFNTAFFSLLSGNNLLSHFFRTTLLNKKQNNFLLFYSDKPDELTLSIRLALMECTINDDYTNIRCISWINLLLSEILRSYSKTMQFYDYTTSSDFSLILLYIQNNYQNLTLSSLAEYYHYTEPYLSRLIHQNTGKTFSELIKSLRLNEAIKYLLNTDMKLSEIAERVGYNSTDHFSRTFRSEYHVSPQQYRKENRVEEILNPFTLA